jgi:hypothetical protein
MIQRPLAVGLKVCQHALVDAYTRRVSLVNCLRQLRFRDFPAAPQSLVVCAVLNDGLGEVELSLIVSLGAFDELDELWVRSWKQTFVDPLKETWFLVRFDNRVFFQPGRYLFALYAGSEQIAQTTLDVMEEQMS